MTLSEALASDVGIRLICKSCGAHQPAYVHEMLDRHGPDTELDEALRLAACLFCKTVGQFTAMVTKVD